MTPSPSPIDVSIHTDPAPTWQIVAAYGPLIAAFIALVAAAIAAAGVWQRWRADNRAEWWRRAQWAMDASRSEDSAQAVMGQKAIDVLSRSRLATSEELEFLKVATENPLEALQEQVGTAGETHDETTGVDGPPASRDNDGDRT